MAATPAAEGSRRRVLLRIVAALLSLAAALAIATLLFGDFGSTEGRILGTTTVLAAYGLLALPAAMLWDRRHLPLLAAAVGGLAVAGATLVVIIIWSGDAPMTLGKTTAAINGWLAASVQVAALVLRRQVDDPPVVRRLFAASTLLALVLAALFTALTYAEIDSVGFGRVFGSLLVLDVLLVSLQPILARARPTAAPHHVRVALASGEVVDLDVAAPDQALAAAQAIRAVAPRTVSSLAFEVALAARGSVRPPRQPISASRKG